MSYREITILKIQEPTRSIASLTRIMEEELSQYRKTLPKGFREEVDCDEDTVLFLHVDFLPLDFQKTTELLLTGKKIWFQLWRSIFKARFLCKRLGMKKVKLCL